MSSVQECRTQTIVERYLVVVGVLVTVGLHMTCGGIPRGIRGCRGLIRTVDTGEGSG